MARRRTIPLVKYPEELIASVEALQLALPRLRAAAVIGLDTEFIGEESYRPELCLIQLSTDRELLVVDPFACGELRELWDILLDDDKTLVVHAGREEIRMGYFATGKVPTNIFDLQIAAGLVGYLYPIGYAGLVQETLHQSMNKSETLTDWRKRPLSASQIRYAYDDVRYLIPIYRMIYGRLQKWDRLHWAAEEFTKFTEHSTNETVAVEKWRKIKGLGQLNRRELALARELFSWRENYAARINRPVRYLMRDDLLLEIARRNPTKLDDLQLYRGLPRHELGSILDAAKRGAALPATQWPELSTRDNDPPYVVTLAPLLTLALAELCRTLSLAPNLAATQSDIKDLLRNLDAPASEQAEDELCSGWRAETIYPYLIKILRGELVLRVSKPTSRFPLSFETFHGGQNVTPQPHTDEDEDQGPASDDAE